MKRMPSDQLSTPGGLLDESDRLWTRVAEAPDRFLRTIDFSGPLIELDTDDFRARFALFAKLAGVDHGKIGACFVGTEATQGFFGGYALRVLCTLEGHYVEFPTCCTIYKVPRKALIVLGAVLIGVASGASAAYLHPLISGSISGLGALFINILSQHYSCMEPPRLTAMEQFVLTVLSQTGDASIRQLSTTTKLHQTEITPHIKSLLKKGSILKIRSGKRLVRYRVNPSAPSYTPEPS
jgi:DNA-binding transcriptional ArsR family regulator